MSVSYFAHVVGGVGVAAFSQPQRALMQLSY